MRHLSLIVAACALTACIGEPYSRPDLEVPSQYRFALAQSQAPADAAAAPPTAGDAPAASAGGH